jgi:hypothetical protein
MGQGALDSPLQVIEVEDGVLDDAVDRLEGPDRDDHVHGGQAPPAGKEPVGDRDDGEQDQLFGVREADLLIDGKVGRDQRDAGIRQERPEHARDLDPLVVPDHQGEPEDGRERQQHPGGEDRDLERRGKGQQREPRGPLESDGAVVGDGGHAMHASARSAAARTVAGFSVVRHR